MTDHLEKRTEKYHTKQGRSLFIGLLLAFSLGVGIGLFFSHTLATKAKNEISRFFINRDSASQSASLNLSDDWSSISSDFKRELKVNQDDALGTSSLQAQKQAAVRTNQDVVSNTASQNNRNSEPTVVDSASGSGRLAIVIDDCGANLKLAKELVNIGMPFTAAIIPNLHQTKQTIHLMQEEEIPFLIHLPMQAIADKKGSRLYDVGEGQSQAQIEEVIARLFPLFDGAFGLNNHRGSKATADRKLMSSLMPSLKKRDLIFLDSNTTRDSVAYKVAGEAAVTAFKNRQFLDNSAEVEQILKQLTTATKLSEKRGTHIAIAHLRPATVAALKEFYQEFQLINNNPVTLVTLVELLP